VKCHITDTTKLIISVNHLTRRGLTQVIEVIVTAYLDNAVFGAKVPKCHSKISEFYVYKESTSLQTMH